MLRTRNARYRPRRRGMILLVVLTLLTLFALVGISFVLVAGSQETSARIAREAETQFKPNVDPEGALAFFLGQFIYDVNDDINGTRSGLRGQSLARNMYGWWNGLNPGSDPANPDKALNDKPFTGTGRLFADAPPYRHPFFNNPGAGYWPPACASDSFILNFTYFNSDGFVRDPERLGWRADPSVKFSDASADGTRWYAGGANVPYTYPDHNNFYLAQIDPNDGLILVPSFHREYLFGRLDLPATAPPGVPMPTPQVDYNPNWTDNRAKYLTLRPTPAYHPDFPMPLDRWGDVKNLDGFPGGADSIWIDIGGPVMTAPQTRSTKNPLQPLRYKMLVAPLILELDSRVNLNVVGNWLGINATDTSLRENRSNQGWGMWEINPAKVLDFPNTGNPATDIPREVLNLFLGSEGSGAARIRGRHDNYPATAPTPDRTPRGQTLGGSALAGSQGPRLWSQVDYDAMQNDMMTSRQMSTKLGLPKAPTMLSDDPGGSWVLGLPIFPPKSYYNGSTTGNPPENNSDHPAVYNVLRPEAPNRRFSVKDMAGLLRFGGSGSDAQGSDLMRLFPSNLINGSDGRAGLRRNLITLLSADLDRPGALPYSWKPDASGTGTTYTDPEEQLTRLTLHLDNTGFPAAMSTLGVPSLGGTPPNVTNPNNPIPFPSLGKRPSTPSGSEFDGRTWRSDVARRGRIDLLRAALYPYPPAPINLTDMTQAEQYRQAVASRQALAGDIFETLRRVTGAMPVGVAYALPPAPGYKHSAEFQAIRYLAQLAVNIVDYIDTDDISTPFCIPETGQLEWVFGFELPRLVINEVHAQYDNDKNSFDGTVVPLTGHYAINTWVELMNPIPEDTITTGTGTVAPDCTAKLVDTDPATSMQYPVYRLMLADAKASQVLRDPSNSLGNPDFDAPAMTRIKGVVGTAATDWGTITSVRPLPVADRFDDGAPGTPNPVGTTEKLGFYVVAPLAGAAGNFDWIDPTIDRPNFPKTDLDTKQMTWLFDKYTGDLKSDFDDKAEADRPRPMLLLQRLANPRVPENPNQMIPDPTDPAGTRMIPNPRYNPYITIDYHECYVGQVEYGRRFDTAGNTPTPAAAAMNARASWGRNQPFAAFADSATPTSVAQPRKKQDPNLATPPADQPKHTFERQNSREAVRDNFATQQTDPPGMGMTEGTLKKPFDWLIHLDRAPISVGELLHVSALRQFDVLQYFIVQQDATNTAQRHKAPWTDQTARIYRFLEYVSAVNDPYRFDRRTDPDSTTPPPTPPAPRGLGFWGRPNSRVQGKINLNMVMSQEILQAMADPQNGNTFTSDDVKNLFNTMLVPTAPGANQARTPLINLGGSIGQRAIAGPTDRRLVGAQFSPLWPDVATGLNRPFWGLSMGYAKNPTGSPAATDPFLLKGDPPDDIRGLPESVLRPAAGGGLMFDVPNSPAGTDPPKQVFPDYQRKELLAKIFNNFTTRSNVFAVWVTVGFFEVTDETVTPVRLGQEVGKAENRHVRYRMFAIVDRSQMTAFSASLRSKDAMGNPTNLIPDQYVKNVTSPTDPIPGREIALNGWRVEPPTGTSATKKYFVTDSRTGREWEVTDGTILVIDPRGDNEEAVVLKSFVYTDPMTMAQDRKLYANFIRAHGDGAPVICHGNPGPMDRYNPRTDTDVVQYFQLLD